MSTRLAVLGVAAGALCGAQLVPPFPCGVWRGHRLSSAAWVLEGDHKRLECGVEVKQDEALAVSATAITFQASQRVPCGPSGHIEGHTPDLEHIDSWDSSGVLHTKGWKGAEGRDKRCRFAALDCRDLGAGGGTRCTLTMVSLGGLDWEAMATQCDANTYTEVLAGLNPSWSNHSFCQADGSNRHVFKTAAVHKYTLVEPAPCNTTVQVAADACGAAASDSEVDTGTRLASDGRVGMPGGAGHGRGRLLLQDFDEEGDSADAAADTTAHKKAPIPPHLRGHWKGHLLFPAGLTPKAIDDLEDVGAESTPQPFSHHSRPLRCIPHATTNGSSESDDAGFVPHRGFIRAKASLHVTKTRMRLRLFKGDGQDGLATPGSDGVEYSLSEHALQHLLAILAPETAGPSNVRPRGLELPIRWYNRVTGMARVRQGKREAPEALCGTDRTWKPQW